MLCGLSGDRTRDHRIRQRRRAMEPSLSFSVNDLDLRSLWQESGPIDLVVDRNHQRCKRDIDPERNPSGFCGPYFSRTSVTLVISFCWSAFHFMNVAMPNPIAAPATNAAKTMKNTAGRDTILFCLMIGGGTATFLKFCAGSVPYSDD